MLFGLKYQRAADDGGVATAEQPCTTVNYSKVAAGVGHMIEG
jgi:hypothetical protein